MGILVPNRFGGKEQMRCEMCGDGFYRVGGEARDICGRCVRNPSRSIMAAPETGKMDPELFERILKPAEKAQLRERYGMFEGRHI